MQARRNAVTVKTAATDSAMCRASRTVEIGGRAITLAQHFFDTPVAQPLRLPRRADLTGMKVWPTALRILEQLQERALPQLHAAAAAEQRRLRVLELGSGTGVLGLGIAALGGSSVVVTDPNLEVNFSMERSGTSLDWLRANVETNASAIDDAGSSVDAHELEWSSQEHAASLRAACLPAGADFDLVLGSELLYDPDQYEPLLQTLRAFARSPATLAVLGYTERHGGEERFLKKAADDFAIEERKRFERTERASAWNLVALRPKAEG